MNREGLPPETLSLQQSSITSMNSTITENHIYKYKSLMWTFLIQATTDVLVLYRHSIVYAFVRDSGWFIYMYIVL